MTGESEGVTEQNLFQSALETRAQKLSDNTQGTAQGLLEKCGETTAAPFLATHETINELIQRLELKDPEEIEDFVIAIFGAVRGMTDAIIMGSTDKSYRREQAIAGSIALISNVRDAVFKTTNIPNGPNESRLMTDYHLT